MAKRKQNHEEELPFVALMDTMTNVVGVLIIVLVMMAISLSNAVKRVMSELAPATEEQIEQTHREIEEIKQQIAREKMQPVKVETLREQAAKLESTTQEVASLQKDLQTKNIQLVNLDPLEKQAVQLDGEVNGLKKEIERETEQIEELKVKVTATPEVKPPPDKEMNLPESKPIPKDAKIEQFVVTSNGIFYSNTDEVKEAFLQEMQSMAARDLVRIQPRPKTPGVKQPVIYDHAKMIEYFAKKNVESEHFTYIVDLARTRTQPMLTARPKAQFTEPFPQALAFSSNYQKMLRKIRNFPNSVVIFKVASDGYDNYLAARNLSDQFGIPAGWDFAGETKYTFEVPEIQMNPLDIPPPAPAAPPPAPAPKPGAPQAPTGIKAPSLKLD